MKRAKTQGAAAASQPTPLGNLGRALVGASVPLLVRRMAPQHMLVTLPVALGTAWMLERRGEYPGAGVGLAAGWALGALVPPPARAASSTRPGSSGVALTVWSPNGLEDGLRRAQDALRRVRPQAVILHFSSLSAPANLEQIAQSIRALVPGAELAVQVYADSLVTNPDAVARFATDAARRVGARAIIFNAERGLRGRPSAAANVARLLAATRAAAPGVPIGFTSYSSPAAHGDFPWAAWLGGASVPRPVDFVLPQVYPFGDDRRSGTADPTDVRRFAQGVWERWRAYRAEGRMSPDIALGAYVPGAHLTSTSFVPLAGPATLVAFWPWHGLYDDEAIAAARAIAEAAPLQRLADQADTLEATLAR